MKTDGAEALPRVMQKHQVQSFLVVVDKDPGMMVSLPVFYPTHTHTPGTHDVPSRDFSAQPVPIAESPSRTTASQ